MLLRIKTQYRQYEPGEFDDLHQHTYEDTISIIHTFPWEKQRDHIEVGLTNPSVTVEGAHGDFLKLTYFYNGHFILYYYNPSDGLYGHPFNTYAEAYPSIRSFFDGASTTELTSAGFRKESTWFHSAAPHFKDGNFNYEASYSSVIPYFYFLAICGVLPFAGLCWAGASGGPSQMAILAAMIIPLAVIGVNIQQIRLFLNHYRVCKGKRLTISRGHNEFYFGDPAEKEMFRKSDIDRIIIHGRPGRGDSFPALTWMELAFRNGTTLNLSCLLIDKAKFMEKFPGVTEEVYRDLFPFIPRDDLFPS